MEELKRFLKDEEALNMARLRLWTKNGPLEDVKRAVEAEHAREFEKMVGICPRMEAVVKLVACERRAALNPELSAECDPLDGVLWTSPDLLSVRSVIPELTEEAFCWVMAMPRVRRLIVYTLARHNEQRKHAAAKLTSSECEFLRELPALCVTLTDHASYNIETYVIPYLYGFNPRPNVDDLDYYLLTKNACFDVLARAFLLPSSGPLPDPGFKNWQLNQCMYTHEGEALRALFAELHDLDMPDWLHFAEASLNFEMPHDDDHPMSQEEHMATLRKRVTLTRQSPLAWPQDLAVKMMNVTSYTSPLNTQMIELDDEHEVFYGVPFAGVYDASNARFCRIIHQNGVPMAGSWRRNPEGKQ